MMCTKLRIWVRNNNGEHCPKVPLNGTPGFLFYCHQYNAAVWPLLCTYLDPFWRSRHESVYYKKINVEGFCRPQNANFVGVKVLVQSTLPKWHNFEQRKYFKGLTDSWYIPSDRPVSKCHRWQGSLPGWALMTSNADRRRNQPARNCPYSRWEPFDHRATTQSLSPEQCTG